jgi:four helix bundle protein
MDNKEFSKELEKRTLQFAVAVIKMSASLPETVEGKVIRNQISKSCSSVGANYREANRSRSKPDYKNKITISESEASETCYWIEIIKAMNWSAPDKLKQIEKEAQELQAIFTSIGKSLK